MGVVEVTTKYCTCVDTMAEAWAFILHHQDTVGNRPRIIISPITFFEPRVDGEDYREMFEVVVSGMVEKEREENEHI